MNTHQRGGGSRGAAAAERLHALAGRLAGHYWTLAPVAAKLVRPRLAPPSRPWSAWVDDDALGRVRLSGAFAEVEGDGVVVVVHGLGGEIESHYMVDAAHAARAAGLSCLRLNLRGADLSGEDLYHAGLTVDVAAALRSPELLRYRRVFLLGYSLGGHIALRCALAPDDARLAAVAAVCPPLDLDRACRDLDARHRWPYRQYVLAALKAHLAAAVARDRAPVSLARARAIRTFREWDRVVIGPRFGFASPERYYAATSVAPRLGELAVPSLVVAMRHDPMVLASSVRAGLLVAAPRLELCWQERGGHVGFPPGVDLGVDGPRGLEPQIMAWLRSRCSG